MPSNVVPPWLYLSPLLRGYPLDHPWAGISRVYLTVIAPYPGGGSLLAAASRAGPAGTYLAMTGKRLMFFDGETVSGRPGKLLFPMPREAVSVAGMTGLPDGGPQGRPAGRCGAAGSCPGLSLTQQARPTLDSARAECPRLTVRPRFCSGYPERTRPALRPPVAPGGSRMPPATGWKRGGC